MTSLNRYIDIGLLLDAYKLTRKDGAVGIDNGTADQYETNLVANIENLLERVKSGRYKAPPVKRVYIPKGSGNETRPIGIPCFEDKVLQRAVVLLLEPIYEQIFEENSYGFRRGRSSHQALGDLWYAVVQLRGGWILELDISKYFDKINHSELMNMLKLKVRDGLILRLIGKWLNSGVMDKGVLSYPVAGSPQGGVISPLLSNIYLHYVLDTWLNNVVRARIAGKAWFVRYADDAALTFELKSDAERVLKVIHKRFNKFHLQLHPTKTKLVNFNKPASRYSKLRYIPNKPETFDFLGFTHYWGLSIKGNWALKRKTAKDRFNRAIKKVYRWCKENRHKKAATQFKELSRKVKGHYAYYGISGNYRMMCKFRYAVNKYWRYWLNRRSQRNKINWVRFNKMTKTYSLPLPRIVIPRTHSTISLV